MSTGNRYDPSFQSCSLFSFASNTFIYLFLHLLSAGLFFFLQSSSSHVLSYAFQVRGELLDGVLPLLKSDQQLKLLVVNTLREVAVPHAAEVSALSMVEPGKEAKTNA